MPTELNLPLDSETVEGLQKLGRDLVANPEIRAAYLKDPKGTMADYGVDNINPNHLDEHVVKMIADPRFAKAVETRDIEGIREFVQTSLGDRLVRRTVAGTFDFDFDVEVEVEVVVVAVGVFTFVGARSRQANPAELMRRRQIVADAFQKLGKNIN